MHQLANAGNVRACVDQPAEWQVCKLGGIGEGGMYGLLNAALKEFVVSTYGNDSWQRVAETSAPGIVSFNKMAPYPDALTYAMVTRACEVLGESFETVMFGFGEFWVRYTDQQGYGPLFEIAGDSLRDFLLNLDALHVRVGRSFPKLEPPSFRFETVDGRTLRMHYLTRRKDLCPMIPGILHGLSLRFKTALEVTQDTCARKGAAHCEFVLVFPEACA